MVEAYRSKGRMVIDFNGIMKIESVDTNKIIKCSFNSSTNKCITYDVIEDDMRGWAIFIFSNEKLNDTACKQYEEMENIRMSK
jgi:hypothetical protein